MKFSPVLGLNFPPRPFGAFSFLVLLACTLVLRLLLADLLWSFCFAPVSSITRWQYRLICLSTGQSKNQSASPQPPKEKEDAPAAIPPEKLFSKPFLEQQFPEYYGEKAPRPLPSSGGLQQLIDLFNRLGSEGWEYYSREEIGGANLLIFRRPLADDAPTA